MHIIGAGLRAALGVAGLAAGLALYATNFPVMAQTDAALVEEMEAMVAARLARPERPVDPDPTICCLTGKCCRLSSLGVGEITALESVTRTLPFARENAQFSDTSAQPTAASTCAAPPIAPPISMRRVASFYAKSDHFKECTAAAKKLLAIRTKDGQYTISLKDIASTKAEREAYADALSNYGGACLAKLKAEDTSTLLRTANVALIADTVGYFYINPKIPFCTGVIVGGKILTARHCFASGGIVTINPASRFRTFSGNRADLKVVLSETFHQGEVSQGGDTDDWLVLDAPDLATGPSLEMKQPSGWEELLVPSFDPHAFVLNLLGNTSAPSILDPQLDLSPLCRAAVVEGPFIWHACQTENGFSGSPLLAIDDQDKVRVVGVQSGRSERISRDCGIPLSLYFPNFGVAPPAEVIQKLSTGK